MSATANAQSSAEQLPSVNKTKNRFIFRKLRTITHVVIEDWSLSACLGILMALLSFAMDYCIEYIEDWHIHLLHLSKYVQRATFIVSFVTWTSFTLLFVLSATIFVHYIAPQAIGSGIPEMKTIINGVILKEYLSLKTLISKCVGLTLSLGSGLPIGKEGPFVHVASTLATILSKLTVSCNKGLFTHEGRYTEMLATACAVGVACTFSAPVGGMCASVLTWSLSAQGRPPIVCCRHLDHVTTGLSIAAGVLFSIEVTSVYFAVRNYWRGFFAASCSAGVMRLLRLQLPTNEDDFLVGFYQTHFPPDSFFPEELPIFAVLGLVCGLAGALFISFHRSFVLFVKHNTFLKSVNQKHFLIIPSVVTFLIAALTFPMGYGKYIVGHLKHRDALTHLFHRCTWSPNGGSQSMTCSAKLLHYWTADGTVSVFVTLSLFVMTFFLLTILCNAIPVPAGQFMPVFVIGAAFGRFIGELVAITYPEGLKEAQMQIFPGVYAIVCAAAFCGAVTRTVSVCVIVFELTGQIVFMLPVLIAVLIANAVCSYFQPSIYDSITKIKGLPYLPQLPATSSILHDIQAQQIMVRNVKFITRHTTYRQLQELIESCSPDIQDLPIVNDAESKLLLGSVTKFYLTELLNERSMTSMKYKDRTKVAPQLWKTYSKIHSLPSNENSFPQSSQEVPRLRKTFVIDPSDSSDFRKSEEDVSTQSSIHSMSSSMANQESIHSLGSMSSAERRHFHGNPLSAVEGCVRQIIKTLSLNRLAMKHNNSHERLSLDSEQEQLDVPICLDEQHIDPTPFQLVERTSLYKMHSLFCLLGLSRAYVTDCGRLLGVVTLKEIGLAIENGTSSTNSPPSRKITIASIGSTIRKSSVVLQQNVRRLPIRSAWSGHKVSVVPELDETVPPNH